MDGTGSNELTWVRRLTGAEHGASARIEQVESLYQELRHPLHGYLRRSFGVDAGQAEDVVQEVFVELLGDLLEGKKVRHPRAWTFRVAHNKALDLRSGEGRQASAHAEASRRESAPPDAEEDILRDERDRRLATALALLTPSERQCIELRAEGLRYREIAEALGLQVSTVSTFVFRAVKKIARQMHD